MRVLDICNRPQRYLNLKPGTLSNYLNLLFGQSKNRPQLLILVHQRWH